jgi:hypothetical protein
VPATVGYHVTSATWLQLWPRCLTFTLWYSSLESIDFAVNLILAAIMSQRRSQQLPALAPVAPIFHAAGSCNHAAAVATAASPAQETRSHVYPTKDSDLGVLGACFEVDFSRITDSKGKPQASRVGYRVRHKSQLSGKRGIAAFRRHGIELEYLEVNKSAMRL